MESNRRNLYLSDAKRHILFGALLLGALVAAGIGAVIPTLHADARNLFLIAFTSVVLTVITVSASGIGGIASLLMYGGFATLGLTAIRVMTFAALSDLFFLLAAATLLFQWMIRSSTFPFRQPVRDLLARSGYLIAGAFIASAFSPAAEESMIAFLKLAVAVLLIPLVMVLWRPSGFALLIASLCFIGSAAASAITALVVGPPDEYSSRVYGLATHPNSMALISVLALGPTLALLVTTKRAVIRLGFIVVTVLLVWSIVDASGSRSGVLGLLAMYLALTLLLRSRLMFAFLILSLVLAAFAMANGWIDLTETRSLSRLLGPEGSAGARAAEASNEGRFIAIEEAWDDFRSRPFIGVGMYRSGAAISAFVSILVTAGIVGLAAVLAIIQLVLKLGLRMSGRPSSSHETLRYLSIGWVAGYVGLMVGNTFQNAIWERFVWIAPIMVAMLVIASNSPVKPESKLGRDRHNDLVSSVLPPTGSEVSQQSR